MRAFASLKKVINPPKEQLPREVWETHDDLVLVEAPKAIKLGTPHYIVAYGNPLGQYKMLKPLKIVPAYGAESVIREVKDELLLVCGSEAAASEENEYGVNPDLVTSRLTKKGFIVVCAKPEGLPTAEGVNLMNRIVAKGNEGNHKELCALLVARIEEVNADKQRPAVVMCGVRNLNLTKLNR